MTLQCPQSHIPCHLSTYGTQSKECTSLDGPIKGESAHVGSFEIIFSKLVVFVKFLCVNTLSILSSLTAALHVVGLILNFPLLHLTELGSLWTILLFHQKHWQVESKASTRSSRSKQEQDAKQTHQKLLQ